MSPSSGIYALVFPIIATNAGTSETNAATSATNAATSATNAATSETNAAASYDSFDDRYLGAKSSAPTVDNDGDALITGALYFDTTANEMRVSNFLLWQISYTEFYVTKTLWPDFKKAALEKAILAYAKRNRRFGDIKPQPQNI